MRRIICIWGALLPLFVFIVAPLSAQSNYPEYENLYLNDFADVLDPSQEMMVRDKLSQLYAETDVEVSVLTVDSFLGYGTGDDTIESFATNLFNTWGIGDAETNRGILLLLAIEERGVRIETGVGWESRLQAETDRIVETVLVPRLRDGDLGGAMVAGADEIAAAVQEELRAAPVASSSSSADGETRRIISTRVVIEREEFEPSPPRVIDTTTGTANADPGYWLRRVMNMIIGVVSLGAIGAGGYFFTRPPKCKHCERPLRMLDEQKDDAYLNSGQQTEERLDSVNYDVWVCDYDDYVHIVEKSRFFSSYSNCPTCSHKTVRKTTRTLKAATTTSTGQQEVRKNCRHCDYNHRHTVTLPKIVEHDDDHSSGSSGFSSSSSSRSFGGGSSRSSSGSFGGGHSSGGGSSGSW